MSEPIAAPLQPAVTQLLIADGLISDYVELAKQLKSPFVDPGELVEQANFLYPSIWQALGSARDAIAHEGRDLGGFDQLRSAVDPHSGGEIEHGELRFDGQRSLERLGLSWSQESSYSLNLRGVAAAADATEQLKRAIPEADWPALAAEQQRQAAAAVGQLGSAKTPQWMKWAIYVAVVGSIVGAMLLAMR